MQLETQGDGDGSMLAGDGRHKAAECDAHPFEKTVLDATATRLLNVIIIVQRVIDATSLQGDTPNLVLYACTIKCMHVHTPLHAYTHACSRKPWIRQVHVPFHTSIAACLYTSLQLTSLP